MLDCNVDVCSINLFHHSCNTHVWHYALWSNIRSVVVLKKHTSVIGKCLYLHISTPVILRTYVYASICHCVLCYYCSATDIVSCKILCHAWHCSCHSVVPSSLDIYSCLIPSYLVFSHIASKASPCTSISGNTIFIM